MTARMGKPPFRGSGAAATTGSAHKGPTHGTAGIGHANRSVRAARETREGGARVRHLTGSTGPETGGILVQRGSLVYNRGPLAARCLYPGSARGPFDSPLDPKRLQGHGPAPGGDAALLRALLP